MWNFMWNSCICLFTVGYFSSSTHFHARNILNKCFFMKIKHSFKESNELMLYGAQILSIFFEIILGSDYNESLKFCHLLHPNELGKSPQIKCYSEMLTETICWFYYVKIQFRHVELSTERSLLGSKNEINTICIHKYIFLYSSEYFWNINRLCYLFNLINTIGIIVPWFII